MFLLKAFYWGQVGARNNYGLQIRNIVEHAYESLGERPVIIGECGVPMDMKLVKEFLMSRNDLIILFQPQGGISFGRLDMANQDDGRPSNGA